MASCLAIMATTRYTSSCDYDHVMPQLCPLLRDLCRFVSRLSCGPSVPDRRTTSTIPRRFKNPRRAPLDNLGYWNLMKSENHFGPLEDCRVASCCIKVQAKLCQVIWILPCSPMAIVHFIWWQNVMVSLSRQACAEVAEMTWRLKMLWGWWFGCHFLFSHYYWE